MWAKAYSSLKDLLAVDVEIIMMRTCFFCMSFLLVMPWDLHVNWACPSRAGFN
jgi:hypothetical protein